MDPVSTSIDLSPITSSVVTILGTVLTGLAIWLGSWVKAYVASKVDLSKTTLDEKLQQQYNEAATRGIAYAETYVSKFAPTNVDTHSEFVKVAAEYVMRFWPDLVARVGLTPDMVRDTIISRLPSASAKKAEEITVAKAGG